MSQIKHSFEVRENPKTFYFFVNAGMSYSVS